VSVDGGGWQVTRRSVAWGNRWYRVLHDEVLLPDGSTIDYYLSDRPDIVIVLAVTTDDHAVLIRQYRHGAGQVVLELPGGVLGERESPAVAAGRELLEETGYRCETLTQAGTLLDDASRNTNTVHVFVGRGARLVGRPRLDDVEVASGLHSLLVPVADLPDMIARGELRSQISVAATYQCLLRLAADDAAAVGSPAGI
jgi:8-oxo-dGTP pyrophosphatase MutT (NUDIX family)